MFEIFITLAKFPDSKRDSNLRVFAISIDWVCISSRWPQPPTREWQNCNFSEIYKIADMFPLKVPKTLNLHSQRTI